MSDKFLTCFGLVSADGCHGNILERPSLCDNVSAEIWMTLLSPRSEADEHPETSAGCQPCGTNRHWLGGIRGRGVCGGEFLLRRYVISIMWKLAVCTVENSSIQAAGLLAILFSESNIWKKNVFTVSFV